MILAVSSKNGDIKGELRLRKVIYVRAGGYRREGNGGKKAITVEKKLPLALKSQKEIVKLME